MECGWETEIFHVCFIVVRLPAFARGIGMTKGMIGYGRCRKQKPAKDVAIAIANKVARTIWALLISGQSCRLA